MRSLLRLLLLCLMAVALPVQGFAAAGAMHCATMHERMQGVDVHHHDDGADHPHAQAASHHDMSSTDAGSDDSAARVGGMFKCSACAACCVGLGLPASVISVPPGPAEGLTPPSVSRAVATFFTGGPERPPRSVLA